MKKCILTGLMTAVLASGCSSVGTVSETLAPNATIGAVSGATAGGLLGGALGHNIGRFFPYPVARKTAEVAFGGAVAGAVVGGLIGHARDNKTKNRDVIKQKSRRQ